MTNFTERTIINGSLLKNFTGKNVSLHVQVENEADRNSKTITGKTTDNVEVKVMLSEPLNVPVKGWIEVIGVPIGADSIRNTEIILFDQNEGDEAFDKEAHNNLVVFLNNCKDIIPQSTGDDFGF